MKTLKKVLMCAALTGAMTTVATMASAAEVTQLIHFDDANNGWKWYSDVDLNFLFDPTNLQSSVLCADSTNGGNGSCVIEGTQTVLPKMTRPEVGPQSQGSASDDPIVSGTDQAFTLDAFYFLLTGKGEGADNAITATGSNGQSFTFQLGGNYDAPGAPDVTFYVGGAPAGDLVKDTGYVVSFGDLFKDVTWIQFSAAKDAQVRLDCVVATFDGTTTEPLSGFNGGCGTGTQTTEQTTDNPGGTSTGPTQGPEPALLSMLGVGLAGAAYRLRRR
jgi:hypothetical protein